MLVLVGTPSRKIFRKDQKYAKYQQIPYKIKRP